MTMDWQRAKARMASARCSRVASAAVLLSSGPISRRRSSRSLFVVLDPWLSSSPWPSLPACSRTWVSWFGAWRCKASNVARMPLNMPADKGVGLPDRSRSMHRSANSSASANRPAELRAPSASDLAPARACACASTCVSALSDNATKEEVAAGRVNSAVVALKRASMAASRVRRRLPPAKPMTS